MNVLLAHNRYRNPGGEDIVFETERRLLEGAGHRVATFERDNRVIDDRSTLARLLRAKRAVWNGGTVRELSARIERDRPDVVHFHNTFPLISPSAYYACRRSGVAVVQTIHNYRLVCPGGLLFRQGRACEECVGRTFAWAGVRHGCYRGSSLQTAAVAGMTAYHWMRGTWVDLIDMYIALTEFAKDRLVAGGIPEARIRVKPNCVYPDIAGGSAPGNYAVFMGRLAPGKGVLSLLDALSLAPGLPVKIVGDGPLAAVVAARCAQGGQPTTEFLGARSREGALEILKGARFAIVPSESFEAFTMVVIEAFACGVPVIASRIGALAENVSDGVTGRLVPPGDSAALAEAMRWAWDHPEAMREMGLNARREYERRYGPERNIEQLVRIYQEAMESASNAAGPRGTRGPAGMSL